MTGRQDLFQQAMNQGHSAAWDQLWDKAAVYYRQALQEFPDNPQALINLGLALYELQDYEEALACYQQASRVSPNDPLPLEKVAQLFERLGNLDQAAQASLHAAESYLKNRDVNKAIENWLRVTRLNPENLQAHSRLALVYERINEKQKAASEYLAVASLLQKSGDLEKAVRAVNQALKISPNNDDAIRALMLLRDFKPLPRPTRPRGATAPLRMSQVRQLEAPRAAIQPDGSPDPITQARQKALTFLAGLLFEGPEEEESDQSSRHGLQSLVSGAGLSSRPVDRTRIMLHLSQVVDLQTHEKYEQAFVELERAVEAGLDHPAAYFDLGYLYAQSNQVDKAVRSLQYAAKSNEFSLGAHLLIGEILRKEERLQEASTEYLEALKMADSQVVSPDEADDLRQLYVPIIETHRHEKDLEMQARMCDNISGLLMRQDWRTHLSQARQQLPTQSKGTPPIPLAEILTEARSSQIVESINKIHELANQGHLNSAMEEAFYALQLAPTYLPLHTYMGELLMQARNLQEATAKFMVVARTYSTRGESHRAIELYRRIIELAPVDFNARSRLIEQLIARQQMEEAIQEYLELADVYYSLADLDMARKTFTEALRLAQQTRVERSWRVQILHRMADIDLQSLDWRQALRIFEQIRGLQPDDEQARSNLIMLNFRLGQEAPALSELDNYIVYRRDLGQMDKALIFLEGLVKENPERISLRRRLAELYRHAGRTQEAISELDAVGEALLVAGDKKGAIKAIDAILALNPPNKTDYQKLLMQLRSN